MKDMLQRMIREALSEFNENLVTHTPDTDLTEPAKAYVHLQKLVGMHGTPTPDGLTMRINEPVGDIVAVTLQKGGGIYDLIAVDSKGGQRRLDANSFLDPAKVAELKALCSELSVQSEGY